MVTHGSCDSAGGLVEVVTRGHLMEITRGDRLVAEGAVGKSRVFPLTNEQKYASMTAQKSQARIVVLDKTPELYQAVVSSGRIHARGTVHGQCSFTLSARSR